MRIPGIRIECLIAILRQDAYMHEQITKGFGIMNICITRFGIRIGDRKYLNEYTPFGSVSLWFHSLWGVLWALRGFLVAMATVVKVTKVWIFFRPFGPKAHLLPKSRKDRAVNNGRRAWPSFALYYININGPMVRHYALLYGFHTLQNLLNRHLNRQWYIWHTGLSTSGGRGGAKSPPTQVTCAPYFFLRSKK